jgi:hypothetical protein
MTLELPLKLADRERPEVDYGREVWLIVLILRPTQVQVTGSPIALTTEDAFVGSKRIKREDDEVIKKDG